MADASKIVMQPPGEEAFYANNFRRFLSNRPITLIPGTEQWFYLGTGLECDSLAYLYIVGEIEGADVDIEVYRSACVQSTQTDYAVPIPGGSLTMVANAPDITAVDFNIANFGGDRLWFKITSPGGLTSGKIESLCLLLKKTS